MTSECTFVATERQNELPRRIQQKLADAERKRKEQDPAPPNAPLVPSTPETLRILADTSR